MNKSIIDNILINNILSETEKNTLYEIYLKYTDFATYWIILLEINPQLFYKSLYYYSENDIKIAEKICNSNCYNSWFGNIGHCLIYITGELLPIKDRFNKQVDGFYGCNQNINEIFGMNLFNLLIRCNLNLDFKDYYGRTIKDLFYTESFTKRINNDKFKKLVLLYYN